MSLDDIVLSKNDSLPSLQYSTTRPNSTSPNLAGFISYLKVRQVGSTTNLFTLTVTSSGSGEGQITSTSSGVVRFDFSTGNWPSTGTFKGEISFESAAGKTETAPDCQSFIVKGEF